MLGSRIKEAPFRKVVEKLYNGMVEGRIQLEMEREKTSSPINSQGEEALWLSLCSALVKAQGLPIDESLLEVFINEKVYYLLNTLKYLEVMEML